MQDVTLKLESIRDDQRDKYWHHLHGRVRMGKSEVKGSKWLMGQKPFVKEVVGVNHAGRPVKRDVPGKKSYVEARGAGARGVYYWFNLLQGRCYLVQEQKSRTRSRIYYVIVNNGTTHEISESQAIDYVQSTRIESVIRL